MVFTFPPRSSSLLGARDLAETGTYPFFPSPVPLLVALPSSRSGASPEDPDLCSSVAAASGPQACPSVESSFPRRLPCLLGRRRYLARVRLLFSTNFLSLPVHRRAPIYSSLPRGYILFFLVSLRSGLPVFRRTALILPLFPLAAVTSMGHRYRYLASFPYFFFSIPSPAPMESLECSMVLVSKLNALPSSLVTDCPPPPILFPSFPPAPGRLPPRPLDV